MKRVLVTAAVLGLLTFAAVAEGRPGRHCRHGQASGVIYRPIVPAVVAADSCESDDDEMEAKKMRRYLRLANDSKERLTVFVQYETWHMDGSWHWYPNVPDGEEALTFTVEPGQEVDLHHDDWAILARRVRLWAEGGNGAEYLEFKDQDLWLVDEVDGERSYEAPEVETYTFRFMPADE